MHIWEIKANYGRKGWTIDVQSEENTTKHLLEYNRRDMKFNLNYERGKEWVKITEIYRKKKEKRSADNTPEEQNLLEK